VIVDDDPKYFDYQPDMGVLFSTVLPPIQKIMEFGLGSGTHFLLGDGRKVHSVELQALGEYSGWFDRMYTELSNYPSWRGTLINCVDYYEPMINKIISTLFSENYDFVFVDPAVHFRPLLVNECIYRGVPIIAAHDTDLVYDNYPWYLANLNKSYSEVVRGRTTYYFRDRSTCESFNNRF
jgi:hypothetical protein